MRFCSWSRKPGRSSRAAVVLVGLVLLVYLGLFVRWSLANQLGPALCCHLGSGISASLIRGLCWRNSTGEPSLCKEGLGLIPASPLPKTIQAFYLTRIVGLDGKLPLLPLFLFRLVGLFSAFLIVRGFVGGLGGALVVVLLLPIPTFSFYPLTSGPMEAPAISLSPLVIYLALRARPGREPFGAFAVSLAWTAATLTHWSMVVLLLPVLALLVWSCSLDLRRGVGSVGTILVSAAGFLAAPLASLAAQGRDGGFWYPVRFLLEPSSDHASERYQGLLSMVNGLRDVLAQWKLGAGGAPVRHVNLEMLLLTAALLALLSIPLALRPGGARRRLAAPALLAVFFVALLSIYHTYGPHTESLSLWTVVAGSLPLGLAISRSRTGVLPFLAILALGLVVLGSIYVKWQPQGSSPTFRRVVKNVPWRNEEPFPFCEGRACVGHVRALAVLSRGLLRDAPKGEQGRTPAVCLTGAWRAFPYRSFWSLRATVDAPVGLDILWYSSLLKEAIRLVGQSPRQPGLFKRLDLARRITACPLSSSNVVARRCNWLYELKKGSVGELVPMVPLRLPGSVSKWAGSRPRQRAELYSSVRVARRVVLRIWRLAPRDPGAPGPSQGRR